MREDEFIEEFLLAVQERIPLLDIKYEYCEIEDEYTFSFDSIDCDFMTDKEVHDTMMELAYPMLVDEMICNFCIDYREVV